MPVIAALQIGSSPDGPQATVGKIRGYTQAIKNRNCDVVVLPEAVLGGYPKGSGFGTRVGYRTDAGREEYLQYWRQSIDIDGPEIEQLSEMARDCACTLVIGVVERGGSTLYCTAVFISASGEVAGKHRKLIPTAGERLIWGQGDGSTLPVVDSGGGRLAAAICWENYMPLLRTAMYAKGVDVWCAPTVDERDIWQTSMRHIAYEGRMFLVSACQYQPSPSALQTTIEGWPDEQALIRGGSVIFSPMGEALAGPEYGTEVLLAAEIDLDDIVRARYDMDTVGHYARPDVFQLSVNECTDTGSGRNDEEN